MDNMKANGVIQVICLRKILGSIPWAEFLTQGFAGLFQHILVFFYY